MSEQFAILSSGETFEFEHPWKVWKAARESISRQFRFLIIPANRDDFETAMTEEGDSDSGSPFFKHPYFDSCIAVLVNPEIIESEKYFCISYSSVLKSGSSLMGLGPDQTDKRWLSKMTTEPPALFGFMDCDYSSRLVKNENTKYFEPGPNGVSLKKLNDFVPWGLKALGL